MLICFITFQDVYVGGPKLDLPISKAESASRVVRLANVANNKFRKHGTLAMNMLIIQSNAKIHMKIMETKNHTDRCYFRRVAKESLTLSSRRWRSVGRRGSTLMPAEICIASSKRRVSFCQFPLLTST